MKTDVLNKHDLSTLNKGLSAISDARAMIERLKTAGIDTSEHEQNLQYLEQRYNQVKQVFFPNQM